MNCHEVEPYLSSYYDHQLSGELQQAVVAHVNECESCRHELKTYASLSMLTDSSFVGVAAQDLPNLKVPEDLWSGIECALQEVSDTPREVGVSRTVDSPTVFSPKKIRPEIAHSEGKYTHGRSGRYWGFSLWVMSAYWRRAALAALLLVAVGAGIYWFQGRAALHHAPQGHLAQYINTFVHDTDAAQRTMVADYGAQRVDLQEATIRLGYRPVIPNQLPEGYSLEAIYVFEMDCCNCAQYVCHRDGAKPITIFEHGGAHAAHLANCPTQETQCHGQRCQMGQVGKQWIASWQVGPRQITVVGARDVKEVEQLIAHFRQPDSRKPRQGA